MKKILLLKIHVFVLSLLVLAMSAGAQNIKFIKKPLRFPPGGNSVTLTGTVTGKVRPLYTFRARKGQTISVHLISQNDKAYFNVFDVAEQLENGVDGWEISNDWSYTFDATDNYEIVVFVNKGATKYTLEVSLK